MPTLSELLNDYLQHPEDLPIHSAKKTAKYIPRKSNYFKLFESELSPLTTSLQFTRDLSTGDIIGLEEISSEKTGLTNKNSMSLQRALGPIDESVRGCSTNLPFWPGGFDVKDVEVEMETENMFDLTNLLTRHPKLSYKKSDDTNFSSDKKGVTTGKTDSKKIETMEIGQLIDGSDDTDIFSVNKSDVNNEINKVDSSVLDSKVVEILASEDTSIKTSADIEVIKISEGVNQDKMNTKGTEWVEVLDVNQPVDDFHAKVPDPATTYPFELDTFQKQAVMHLEQRDCVFVAAHTSAGKTVVAEYAIALALKHMTRAVYTSPIKALSNQKYRDLKIKFSDVGLLTGDIQINPKASCLIMTTEILQSMLYNGSDIIRDLEWVIFDEVHYINDTDRGHVWEEVLIMLPSHVNIVLLSATVPNTVEFADWIGRIKKRKLYVISTTKRPVPLEHYLYTGCGGKTKDERFLILDAKRNFVKVGYSDAVAVKEERTKKSQQQYGPKKGGKGGGLEKHTWIGLIDHLSRNDLLPVVAFTLSKKRCDSNASNLVSQDLTTKVEKGEIENFIHKCLDRLKGTDKLLPQVLHMRDLLRNGIGVHHSGILPMLKEVVEMLFAKGLVKVLFATETFAMGVNMPARSVVFDSIRKHDGTAFRDLLPSEYIQMAGRAGRRGLDTTGTVIILCKNDVPEMSELNQMMLGKPSKLESQFKLTYSMILNLLRVESLRVEDMMKRSFSESLQLANQSKYTTQLEKLTNDMKDNVEVKCVMCNDVEEFYAIGRDLVEKRKEVYHRIALISSFTKFLQPGRILIISHNKHQNFLACLLQVDFRNKNKLTVFILSDPAIKPDSDEKDPSIPMLECLHAGENINILSDTNAHEVLNIHTKDLVGITNRVLKINADKVVDNIKRRKLPRFVDDPPSSSVMDLVSDLQKIHQNNAEGIRHVSFTSDLGIKDLESVEQIEELEKLRNRIKKQSCMLCPQFHEHFLKAFKYLRTKEEISRIKYLMSEESLQLHPEYKMRIQVLKNLKYIEDNNTVTLKGRIACEMGNHELMVTDLILENIFSEMPIELTVALLSSLVFQQRHCEEPKLTEDMTKGIKKFKEIATVIGKVQRDCGLPEAVGDFVDQFNFGLTEVVFEWAHGLPFDKIMDLTDVQEGIVVKCIQRLDETLKDVRNAARIVGDPSLVEKMEEASAAIKRDIVFAASLYTV